MSEEDSRTFLYSYINPHDQNERCADRIVAKLGHHPLAIAQAGYYIQSTSTSLHQYVDLLSEDRMSAELVFRNTQHFRHIDQHNCSPSSMPASLFDTETLDDTASSLLAALACFHSSYIDATLLRKLRLGMDIPSALSTLAACCLITVNCSDDTVKLHPFARLLIRSEIHSHPNKVKFAESTLTLLNQACIPHFDTIDTYNKACAYALHVEAVLRTIIEMIPCHETTPSCRRNLVLAALWLFQYFFVSGQIEKGVACLCDILQWGSTTLNTDALQMHVVQRKAAVGKWVLGDLSMALEKTQQLYTVQIHALVHHNADTVHCLNNIAVIYEDQGLHSKAEEHHRQALEIKTKLFGPRNTDTLITINNLALSLQSQKKHIEAEKLFRQALLYRRRALPPGHNDIIVSISNLGISLQLQGRVEESKPYLEQALAERERFFGQHHLETLKSRANLALLHDFQGQLADTAAPMRRIHTSYKSTFGMDHPDTIRALKNYAILLHKQTRFVEAEDAMFDVLSSQERAFGEEDKKTLDSLQFLALLLYKQGKFLEALEMARELLDKRQRVLGEGHEDTVEVGAFVRELEGLV